MKNTRLLFVPGLFAIVAVYCTVPAFFYAFGDPDFGYLMNSLRLTEGMFAWHVDHPGSILQIFGAVVIEAVKILRHQPDGLTAVTSHLHEIFYGTMALSLAALLAAQFLLGWVLVRRGYGFLIATTAQLTPALFATMPSSLVHLNSETILTAAGLLVAAAFVPFAEPGQKLSRKQLILFGSAIGLAMTTKANIWPVALLCFVPLCTEDRNKKTALVILASLLTTFVLVTVPAWQRFGYWFPWLTDLFFHAGRYGAGAGFITSLDSIRHGFGTYVDVSQRQQVVAVLTSLALLAFALKQRWRIYLPVLLAMVVTVFLLLKHPAPRYALALVPVVAISLLVLPRLPKHLGFAVAAMLFILSIDGFCVRGVAMRSMHLELSRLNRALTADLGGANAACAVVMLDLKVPLPEAGFMKGHDEWSANMPWAERLNALFPRYFSLLDTGATRFGKAMPLTAWIDEVNRFPCQVFVASKLLRSSGSLAAPELFAGEFRDITSAGEQDQMKLFRHDGALKAVPAKN